VALDLAHRHAAGVEAQNLVEAVKVRLPFGNQSRLECTATVARDCNLISTSPSSVGTVFELVPLRLLPRPLPAGSPLLLSQVLSQFGAERPLDQDLLEPFE
jgi:hypothetical protein